MLRITGLAAAAAGLLYVVLSSALPASAQAPAAVPAADAMCQTVQDFAAGTRQALPQPIDAATQLIDVVADCDAGVLTFVLGFVTPGTQPTPEVVDAARGAFLVGTCQQGIAEATQWIIAGEFHAADGTVTDRFETTAADCATITTTAPAAVAAYVADVAAAFPAPLRLDETLELSAARAEEMTLILAVHLSGDLTDTAAVMANLSSRLVPTLCGTSQIVALFRVGAAIRLDVVDDAGRGVMALPLDPPTCASAIAAVPVDGGTPVAPDAGTPVAEGPTPEELCTAATAAGDQVRAGLPTYGEDGTETVAIAVDCPTATVTFQQNYVGPADLFAGPALTEQENRHHVVHCSADGFAAAYAMTVITQVRVPDGPLLATLTTAPADCDFITAAMVANALPVLAPDALAARLAEIVTTNTPQLPFRLNDTLSLVAMFNGPAVLVVFYQIDGTLTDAQLQGVAEQIQQSIYASDCNDPGQLQLLRSGASFTYRYSDTQANSLFSVTVTAATCGVQ